ncbi:MAG: hypothetical protein BWY31_00193 [Lentisphaerae bacterium ADurb.Bin242]|nr:MAG: hypothetical protein BWY31_00193 [Lentisphaerae bacterium ADurb.Bin242]
MPCMNTSAAKTTIRAWLFQWVAGKVCASLKSQKTQSKNGTGVFLSWQTSNVETNTINYHIKNVFDDRELQKDSVIRKFRITAADGESYDTNNNRRMIIAVGFNYTGNEGTDLNFHLSQGLFGILISGGKDTSFKIHTRVISGMLPHTI